MPISDSKRQKQLESYIGGQALKVEPFRSARKTSEAVLSAMVLKVLAEEGPSWPYLVIKKIGEQWKKDEGRLAALGLELPTNAGIIKRIEDLEHTGFVRSLTPKQLEKTSGISARASKVFDLTTRGVAVAFLLNAVKLHDDVILKIVKRTDQDGVHKISYGRLVAELIERGKTPYVLRYALISASIRLLHEIEEEEFGIRNSQSVDEEEDYRRYKRHAKLTMMIAFDFPDRFSKRPEEALRRLSQLIGPPRAIKEECAELVRFRREHPEIKEAAARFCRGMIEEDIQSPPSAKACFGSFPVI